MLLRHTVEIFDYIWRGFARKGWIMIHEVSNKRNWSPLLHALPFWYCTCTDLPRIQQRSSPLLPFHFSSPSLHYPFEIHPHLTHTQKVLDYCPTAAHWPLSLVPNSSMAPINQRSREPLNRYTPDDSMLWNDIQAMNFTGDSDVNNHFGWVLFFFH